MSPQITINLDSDQQAQVAQWKTGETYQITIEQTGPGQFNMVSQDGTSEESEEAMPKMDENARGDEMMSPGSASDTGGTTIPTTKNSAVAALVMSKRAKK